MEITLPRVCMTKKGLTHGNTGVQGLLSRQHLNRTYYTSKEAQFNTEQSYIGVQNICLAIKKIYHFLILNENNINNIT